MSIKYPKLWKFMFWFAAIVVGLEFIGILFDPPQLVELAVMIFNAISLFPLYGFAYQISIGSKPISTMIFLLNVPIYGNGVYVIVDYVYRNPSTFQITVARVVLMIMALYLFALYAYAFKSDALWQSSS